MVFGLQLITVGTLLFGIYIGAVLLGVFGPVYSKKQLKEFRNEQASLVLSKDGSLIGKYFADNRTNIQFDQLPKHLVQALVATEDARYFEHEGVDSRSLLRVLVKTLILRQERSGGGSTITQQLAKNMYGRKQYGFMSMPVNKTKEVLLASRLEEVYSKEEILTLYLNTVPFGEDVLGIESASRRYFNKKTTRLNQQEAAVLIGMLKANTYYNPRLYPENALRRRNVVLAQMEKYGYLNAVETDSLQALPLKLDYANISSEGPANYFLVQVRREAERILTQINKNSEKKFDLRKSGLLIETTLDLDLHLKAIRSMNQHLSRMQKKMNSLYRSSAKKKSIQPLLERELKQLGNKRDLDTRKTRELISWDGYYKDSISVRDSVFHELRLLHAGMIALDPHTGAVRSWVGGIDYRSHPYDQVLAQRQTASAFKPILYASALAHGAYPCMYLDNDPIVLEDKEGWSPRNYDRSSGGNFSMAAALARSMNIPTVDLYFQQQFGDLQQLWKELGFSGELLDQPSTALGTASASLLEMAVAYAAFANGGNRVDPYFIARIKTTEGAILYEAQSGKDEKVLESQVAESMTAMLQKAVNEGTGRSVRTRYGVSMDLAAKTGTSQDYGDAWFMAYTPSLVMATRVGASYPSVHFDSGSMGSGSALALPIVAGTLHQVEGNSRLRKRYGGQFHPMNNQLLACEDYVDDSNFEKLFDKVFNKEGETTSEKASRKARKKAKRREKKSFFKRLFGKKEN